MEEVEEGGKGTVVCTTTTKATEDGVGRGLVGTPPLSALPLWRWSVHHLGMPAGDTAVRGDAGPSYCNGEGASAAR